MAWDKKKKIDSQVPSIVRKLEKAATEVARLAEEGEREAELERLKWAAQLERWRREEDEQRREKALTKSKDELLEIIESWAAAKRLDDFFSEIEQKAAAMPVAEQESVLVRLNRARELAGSTDALARFLSWRDPEELLESEISTFRDSF